MIIVLQSRSSSNVVTKSDSLSRHIPDSLSLSLSYRRRDDRHCACSVWWNNLLFWSGKGRGDSFEIRTSLVLIEVHANCDDCSAGMIADAGAVIGVGRRNSDQILRIRVDRYGRVRLRPKADDRALFGIVMRSPALTISFGSQNSGSIPDANGGGIDNIDVQRSSIEHSVPTRTVLVSYSGRNSSARNNDREQFIVSPIAAANLIIQRAMSCSTRERAMRWLVTAKLRVQPNPETRNSRCASRILLCTARDQTIANAEARRQFFVEEISNAVSRFRLLVSPVCGRIKDLEHDWITAADSHSSH